MNKLWKTKVTLKKEIRLGSHPSFPVLKPKKGEDNPLLIKEEEELEDTGKLFTMPIILEDGLVNQAYIDIIARLLGPDNQYHISNSLLFLPKSISSLLRIFPFYELCNFRKNNIWREEVNLELTRRSRGLLKHQFILGLLPAYQEKAISYEPRLTLDSLVERLSIYEVLLKSKV